MPTMLDELETSRAIERVDLEAARTKELGSEYTNLFIIHPKEDT